MSPPPTPRNQASRLHPTPATTHALNSHQPIKNQDPESRDDNDDVITVEILEQTKDHLLNNETIKDEIVKNNSSQSKLLTNTTVTMTTHSNHVTNSDHTTVAMDSYEKRASKFDVIERESAQAYITCLLQVLPSLLDVTSVCELDETLQTFASNFCAG